MLALEGVTAGAKIRGISGLAAVEVVRAEWIGSDAVNVVCRGPDTLLVRADVAQPQIAKTVQPAAPTGAAPTPGDKSAPTPVIRQPPCPQSRGVLRRFYAKVALDPNRPTPQVSNIAQSILSDLDRVRVAKITLTLDIDVEAAAGFPEDVENVVRDNARDLRFTDFGFEEE
jgi:hypothetical protein